MYEEKKLVIDDSIELFTRQWRVEQPVANVVITHGYTDHSGRYEQIAHYLNQHQISVFAFDLRGHGQSTGERTTIQLFDEYIDDLDYFIKSLGTIIPLFLLGHSMGGLITYKYSISGKMPPVRGIILTSPSLIQNASASKLKIKIVLVLSKLLARKRSSVKLDASALSTDKVVIEEYNNDPLVANIGAKWKFLGELMRVMNTVPQSINQMKVPFIVFHDLNDRLSNPAGSKLLFEKSTSLDKTYETIEKCGHELLQGDRSTRQKSMIIDWINNRL
ncbi:alpha/beta hydrolase [Chryseobacterium sp. RP-3-3]|uniref:Alpha/beta hydrolase n=1 Tax=Chryseobacterium antibioticum TaxID=2728847 RepID=A0A7Y0FQ97_9FLAO|nr:alpha/beta hydrolase [Chryseobacterium antibioticum]NML68967.1 alpha/beta hydrolase [Chryseobacterium antibioticum]